MTKSHLIGYFAIAALLIASLVGSDGGTSEAAPLLGFTDTPPPATEPPPPPPTNTPPPPPPPTHTAEPQPTATPRPGGREKPSGPLPTATLILILPVSGAEAGRPVAPWVVGGIALFLGWLFYRVGQERKERGFRSSPPRQE